MQKVKNQTGVELRNLENRRKTHKPEHEREHEKHQTLFSSSFCGCIWLAWVIYRSELVIMEKGKQTWVSRYAGRYKKVNNLLNKLITVLYMRNWVNTASVSLRATFPKQNHQTYFISQIVRIIYFSKQQLVLNSGYLWKINIIHRKICLKTLSCA